MGVRKNQIDMSSSEWAAFVAAIRGTHGASAATPAYRRFVNLHVAAFNMANMSWGVHSMPGMRGRNFLAWHRRFVKRFEERLQVENPAVTIPYWDSITNRSIPTALTDPNLLAELSFDRDWDPSKLTTSGDLAEVRDYSGSFAGFQSLVEGAIHSGTHNAVGGDMAGASSPTDPLFWLHHSFLDKLWADWQASPRGADPLNVTEELQPANLTTGVPFTVTVSSILSISTLGYSYA